MLLLTALSLLGWLHLALWRLRPGPFLPELPPPVAWPELLAIVPARDEAATIAAALGSLLAQDYPGRLRVILVDDHSSDGTATLARALPDPMLRLEVVAAPALPPGWTGKLWAQAAGLAHGQRLAPDARWLLLTDADIVHEPASLRRLVSFGEARGLDLVSLMALLRCSTAWERLLIPAFVFFFQKLYPFRAVADPASPVAAAAGGCLLVRADRLQAAGGLHAVRDRLIDDCALARLVKGRGGAIWLGLTRTVRSVRAYDGLAPIWAMVARTAFTQLGHSWTLLAGTVAGMLLLYAVPPLGALLLPLLGWPLAGLTALLAWLVMAATYLPTIRLYGLPWRASLTLPAAAMLYVAMTVDSARRHGQRTGGGWKGRVYPQGACR